MLIHSFFFNFVNISNFEGKFYFFKTKLFSFEGFEFLTGKNVLPVKGLLEKATTIKRFDYSPLGSELKK